MPDNGTDVHPRFERCRGGGGNRRILQARQRDPPFFPNDILRTDGRAREALGISIGEGRYADEAKIVANLKKPLAMVHGEGEQVANLSYLRGIKMPTLWRGAIQIIPDAGHTPQWEQPEQFNRLLMECVEDCDQNRCEV